MSIEILIEALERMANDYYPYHGEDAIAMKDDAKEALERYLERDNKNTIQEYENKLTALLNGLECKNIDQLIHEEPDVFLQIGQTIAKSIKFMNGICGKVNEMAKQEHSGQ